MKHISEILAAINLPTSVGPQLGRATKTEMKPDSKFSEAPPIRFELTEDQVKMIEEAKSQFCLKKVQCFGKWLEKLA